MEIVNNRRQRMLTSLFLKTVIAIANVAIIVAMASFSICLAWSWETTSLADFIVTGMFMLALLPSLWRDTKRNWHYIRHE